MRVVLIVWAVVVSLAGMAKSDATDFIVYQLNGCLGVFFEAAVENTYRTIVPEDSITSYAEWELKPSIAASVSSRCSIRALVTCSEVHLHDDARIACLDAVTSNLRDRRRRLLADMPRPEERFSRKANERLERVLEMAMTPWHPDEAHCLDVAPELSEQALEGFCIGMAANLDHGKATAFNWTLGLLREATR